MLNSVKNDNQSAYDQRISRSNRRSWEVPAYRFSASYPAWSFGQRPWSRTDEDGRLAIFAHPLEKVKLTVLLSQVYERKQAADDQQAMDVIKGVSPIAWQHVNLFSTFEFNQAASKVDIDALASRYDDPVFCR
jgi:hypothetical protein